VGKGYWDDVRRLAEIVDRDMEKAESDPWDVAIELTVERIEHRIPF
jgi:hypothetical protein